MVIPRKDIGKELSSKLNDIDKAYLAGLFDGEGCISPTWGSKKYFLTKEQRERTTFFPRLQFVISNKNSLLLDLMKIIVGYGNIYRGKNKVYGYRISAQKEVLDVVNALIPYVKLKKEALYLSKEAILYQLQRKLHSRWTSKEKVWFYNEFMVRLLKLLPSGKKRGRPSKYSLTEILHS